MQTVGFRAIQKPMLMLALVVWAGTASAEELSIGQRDNTPGACLAPSVMKAGTLAWCAEAGFPEVGFSLRQGVLGWLELNTRARINYLAVSAAVEGLARFALVRKTDWDVAPYLGVGLVYDAGATYFD